jgi:hypothetical protein
MMTRIRNLLTVAQHPLTPPVEAECARREVVRLMARGIMQKNINIDQLLELLPRDLFE